MPESFQLIAAAAEHQSVILQLQREYFAWIMQYIEQDLGIHPQELLGMTVDAYIQQMQAELCVHTPPEHWFYLIRHGDQFTGTAGMRRLANGDFEIKRVYLQKSVRGKGIAATVLRDLIQQARAQGAQCICLDTGPFMQAAQQIYRHLGFTPCAAYPGSEVPPILAPHWMFMALDCRAV